MLNDQGIAPNLCNVIVVKLDVKINVFFFKDNPRIYAELNFDCKTAAPKLSKSFFLQDKTDVIFIFFFTVCIKSSRKAFLN